ncbi:MAG: DUF169 domain-containing protein, partial [Deltaproteobacteria bacterium]|nr:DUF169 domain-containing protein [Deltaproteobacteria bacterium]
SALNLKFNPVAIIWSDENPEDALQFKQGRWGCVMSLFAHAVKGCTAVFDRKTFGCWGGGVGLGFGNQYVNVPGGIEEFYRFLSTGNNVSGMRRMAAEKICNFVGNDLLNEALHGERYIKSPELVKKFVESLPIADVPTQYVVFKPLKDVDLNKEDPVIIVFSANPDQLSAMVILANYGNGSFENVIIPYAAGCQTIGIFPYREAKHENPRAVIGLTDISARKIVRSQLGRDMFTFAVPLKMFKEMEAHVEGSFLQRENWNALKE